MIDQATMEAVARQTPWRFLARPVAVTFPLANTATEVRHLLGVVPDGMQIVWEDAHIRAVPGRQWTAELAYLQSDGAASRCVVVFGVLREEPLNVQTTP